MFNEKAKDISQPKVVPTKVEEKKVEDPQEKVLEEALAKTSKIEQIKDYKVVAALLNVRSNPSDKASIVGTVKSGTTIKVNTAETKGVWAKVTEPLDGYVMNQFIAPVK